MPARVRSRAASRDAEARAGMTAGVGAGAVSGCHSSTHTPPVRHTHAVRPGTESSSVGCWHGPSVYLRPREPSRTKRSRAPSAAGLSIRPDRRGLPSAAVVSVQRIGTVGRPFCVSR
jgi:hypothetical protein